MKWLALIALFTTQAMAAKPGPATYKLDPTHATVAFKVSHLGFSNVIGMFGGAEGTFTIDEANPEKSSFNISVRADTVQTMVPKRDDHLRGPDFFNVKQFPKITMKSTNVKRAGDNAYDVTADLTLHGVTKPVKFTFNHFKTAADPFNPKVTRTGGEAVFKVKRSDYNMKYMNGPGQIGDEVEMTISIEGTR